MVLKSVTGIAVLLLVTGCHPTPTPSVQVKDSLAETPLPQEEAPSAQAKDGLAEAPLPQEEPPTVQVKPDSKPTRMLNSPSTLVSIVPVRTMRTTDSTPRAGVRIDNGSSTVAGIKLLSASYIATVDAPALEVGVLALKVANVPFGENGPETAVTSPSRSTWIGVPPGQSRSITITLDHNLPYAPMSEHHYLLSLKQSNGTKTQTEVVLSDAIRHPIRR